MRKKLDHCLNIDDFLKQNNDTKIFKDKNGFKIKKKRNLSLSIANSDKLPKKRIMIVG